MEVSGWNVQQKWKSLGTSGEHLYMYGIKLFLILHRLQKITHSGRNVQQKMDITGW